MSGGTRLHSSGTQICHIPALFVRQSSCESGTPCGDHRVCIPHYGENRVTCQLEDYTGRPLGKESRHKKQIQVGKTRTRTRMHTTQSVFHTNTNKLLAHARTHARRVSLLFVFYFPFFGGGGGAGSLEGGVEGLTSPARYTDQQPLRYIPNEVMFRVHKRRHHTVDCDYFAFCCIDQVPLYACAACSHQLQAR